MGAGDGEDRVEKEVGLDVAEGVHVTFAVVEEEEVGSDAGKEGGSGEEEGRHGGLMSSWVGWRVVVVDGNGGRQSWPTFMVLCQVTRWPEVEASSMSSLSCCCA